MKNRPTQAFRKWEKACIEKFHHKYHSTNKQKNNKFPL